MCSLVSDTSAVEKDGISNNFYIKGTASQIPPVEVKISKIKSKIKITFTYQNADADDQIQNLGDDSIQNPVGD